MDDNFDIARWNHLPEWWNDLPRGDVRQLIAAVAGNLQRTRTSGLGQSDTIGFIRQLAITGDRRAIPVLRKALDHERRSVRTDAALALHALGEPDAVAALLSDLDRSRGSIDGSADEFHIIKALECVRDPRAAAIVAEHHAAQAAVHEPSSRAKSGCFVATAACGDPFAPEVIYLSSFRDEVLTGSRIGRLVIAIYYALSPPIAAIIARSNSFRKAAMTVMVRPAVRFVGAITRTRYR